MFTVMPTTEAVLSRGIDVAVAHGLAIWDAIILAAAAEAGCRMLLSEDMHEGFTWGGVTIVNPFASPPTNCSTTCVADRYVSTSAPCASSAEISRVSSTT